MAKNEDLDPRPFQLIAGHVALDLINTLDDRFIPGGTQELLASYDDLLRFATQSELLTERQARKLKRADALQTARTQVLNQVRELRETLAAVAYAQLDGKEIATSNLAILEEHFKQAGSHRHLIADQSANPSHLAWSWRGLGSQIAAPLSLLAQAAEELMLSDQATHLRSCSSDTCRWLFLDTSKNHTRRWCDMKVCGNRMKARRFQARQGRQELH
jgi:predicted RNA-binding Zn ribbon-like protein